MIEEEITTWFEVIFKFIFMVLVVLFFMGLFAGILMYLWNWLIPDLFGINALTYWQAVGLLAISKILFSGLSLSSRKYCKHCKKGYHVESPHVKQSLREKFMNKWKDCKEQ